MRGIWCFALYEMKNEAVRIVGGWDWCGKVLEPNFCENLWGSGMWKGAGLSSLCPPSRTQCLLNSVNTHSTLCNLLNHEKLWQTGCAWKKCSTAKQGSTQIFFQDVLLKPHFPETSCHLPFHLGEENRVDLINSSDQITL